VPLRIEMDEVGPPAVLHAVERPPAAPGPGEVVVRVAAAAVNRADCFIRSGEWTQAGGFPYVPGLEACGTVARVGEGVGLAVGDRVITMMQRMAGIHGERPGGYQEELLAPAATLARLPDGLELVTGAALGLAAVTAHLALRALEVGPGMRVLVHGGASGVGTMAVQLAIAAGARVVATGTRRDKLALVESLGAEKVVCTKDADWPAQVGRVDRVFDLVGAATFGPTVELMAPGGRLCFVGGTSGGELAFSGWALMRPVTLTGWSSETLDQPTLQAAIDAIAAAHAAGRLRVAELCSMGLAEAAAAHALLEAGRVAGRIVLVP
jgi:NADPH2:quinone reductase